MGSARAGPSPRLIALAVFSALLSACAHSRRGELPRTQTPANTVVQASARTGGSYHRVKAGETLFRIARTYQVSLETLLHENLLKDAARVSEGTLLFIPGAARELAAPLPDALAARVEARPPHRAGPAQIPRAGSGPLDPAAGGAGLAWPASGVLISGFGPRDRDHHDGIDLAAPEGTPVLAAEGGVVLFAGEQRGYGNLVLLSHPGDLVTVYAHNAQNLVVQGEHVGRGDPIARIGHTGNATGPHLHFEVRLGAQPRDPLGFLR